MRTHFAEVLAREEASLAEVTDGSDLASWRRRVVRELMNPRSPYVLALRQTGKVPGRADFLCRWRGLIAEMVERLLQRHRAGGSGCSPPDTSPPSGGPGVDAHETAVLILAALHGGSALSQVAQSPWPLDAALDLALARLAGCGDGSPEGEGNE